MKKFLLFFVLLISTVALSAENQLLTTSNDTIEVYQEKIGKNILKQIPKLNFGEPTSEQIKKGAYQISLTKKQDSILNTISNKGIVVNGTELSLPQFKHLILKEPQQNTKIEFINSDTKEVIASHELKMHKEPIFKNDVIVFGILFLVLALVFFTSQSKNKGLKLFYKIIPALLLCYLIPSILTSTGVISNQYSGLYGMAKTYLLPCALVLMTLSVDLKGLLNLGPKALIMFLTATVGIVLGGPFAVWIFSFISPETVGAYADGSPQMYESTWRGLSTLAGSWIGGNANQTAMYEMYKFKESLYGGMITVDIVVANIWMALLLIGIAKKDKLNKFFKADNSSIDNLIEKMENYEKQVERKATLKDYMVLLGLAFGAVAFAHFASGWLADMFVGFKDNLILTSLSSKFFWMIMISTIFGFIYSFTKARSYEGVGASKIGSVFIYILVATIGMKMDIMKIFDKPLLIAVGLIWMAFHVVLLVVVGRLIKAPYFFLAVGSKANIGGAASAPVVAGAFHPSLATVGAILAVFGYFLGTIGAMLSAVMMQYVSPCIDCVPQ